MVDLKAASSHESVRVVGIHELGCCSLNVPHNDPAIPGSLSGIGVVHVDL